MNESKTNNVFRSLLIGLLLVSVIGCDGSSDNESDAVPTSLPAIGGGSGGTGVAILSWTPPVTNTDGSPVDLLGYMIYQGSSPTNLTAVRMVGVLDTTTVVDDLPTGTHFFAVAAVSMSGARSTPSNIQSKTI